MSGRSPEKAAAAQAMLQKRLQRKAAGGAPSPAIPRGEAAAPAPVSYAQERLWFLDRLEPGGAAYNIASAVLWRGPLRVPVLVAAFGEIIRRHESLRTTFAAAEGEGEAAAVQVVAPGIALPLSVVDLTALAGETRTAERERLAEAAARWAFDLERGPLLLTCLLRLQGPGDGEEEHVLLAILHHIAADGWSLGLLLEELTALYGAFAAGRPSPLPELPLQYPDFAAWQRGWLRGEALEAQLVYWRRQLAGAPALLELPTDRPRPARQGFRGGRAALSLPRSLADAAAALARREGASLFMTLMAAFQALLCRYTGEEDVPVGTPVAGRVRVELEPLIGLFVNTLVLRGDLSGDPSFRELLGRVREVALEAFAHQDVPFEKLVEELRPERNLAHTPLFQVMLILQNAPTGAVALGGLELSRIPLESGSAKLDLMLSLAEGDGLTGQLEYRTDLFDRATMVRLLGHFEVLLRAAVAEPERRLSSLPLLTEPERRQSLEWNDTRTVYPGGETCLHRLIEAQVDRSPDAVALVFEGERLTYGQLDGRANQLARLLRTMGVGPEVRVGVSLERSLEMVVALFGVLKAGGAYVPLEPDYPPERLRFMREDAGIAVLLGREDGVWAAAASQPGERLRDWESPDQAAYVIYTSGSTGRPKGVVNSHRGVVNRLLWMPEAGWLGPRDQVLQKTPFSFDVSGWELYWPLIHGARLVLARPGGHQDGAYLARLIVEQGITVLHFVPSMLQVFLEEPGLEACASLRRVVCSGEALSAELARRFEVRLGSASGVGAELYNLYGPTEAAIEVTCQPGGRRSPAGTVPIGRPIANLRIHLLDLQGRPVPAGVPGELHIGGVGVARGYLNRPELTAEKFVPDPFVEAGGEPGSRLYRSGDLARHLPDGVIDFLGRIDHQIKLRGFRIELGEIDAVLASHPTMREAVTLARRDGPGDQRLIAYVVPRDEPPANWVAELRAHLREKLPDYMVPAAFVPLGALPLLPNGKLDRKALPSPEAGRGAESLPAALPGTEAERAIAGVWREVLGLPEVGIHDNFFDLGGHSLLLIRVHRRLRETLGRDLPLVDLFRYPTVGALAGSLSTDREAPAGVPPPRAAATGAGEIAVVGMAGRFPGAASVAELWRRLCAGEELIAFFSEEEGLAAGLLPEVLRDPRYVNARGVLAGPELFDAAFFDYSPREAQVMDPQQRVLLETAWQALEDAGYDPETWPGRIGVFAGASENVHLQNVYADPELMEAVGQYQVSVGNRNDYLATRVSYKLGLKGPSVNVQTACSTSLVAVHMACRSLLAGECDLALAGGVSVTALHGMGYLYEEGGIASPDGHCRAFDAEARGTVTGNGAALVALKRLADAMADGDRIDAVIRGSAINNDGSLKVGFTAPSVDGQAEVIAAAQAAAGVDPGSIGYIEAHGTGTALGDPIEIAALTQTFGASTTERGFCAIGSIKTNLGHLDAAAGVSGLIKAVLAVKHGLIPPSLHYRRPNPAIDFESGPFRVNAELAEWRLGGAPRRAGVSSFGIGGTNAHAVLESAPAVPREAAVLPPRSWHLLLLSAKTATALDAATANLAAHLEQEDVELADVAFTLQAGRRALAHRRMLVCESAGDAAGALRALDPERVLTREARGGTRPVIFLFPGQGSQSAGMGADLHAGEPVFREALDRCAELLRPELGGDLRELLARDAERTDLAQPALFAVEYALARLWMAWGVKPRAMIGHSIGEYVAACLAGVFSLEDGLRLVAARGRLMQSLPEGAMLGAALPEEELRLLLLRQGEGLEIAAVNGPADCVATGPCEAVEALRARLEERGVDCRRLHTSHAFHSRMMDGAVAPFRELVAKVSLRAPRIPYVSNVTGTWITAGEAADPDYWARHLRQTVRFADGLGELLREPDGVLLEVGPGRTLSALAGRHPHRAAARAVVPSLGRPRDSRPEVPLLLAAAGKLWLAGVKLDAEAMHAGRHHRRVPLPTYPFERQRYWVAPRSLAVSKGRPELEAPPEIPREVPAGWAEPHGAWEREVAAFWRETLGIERVGAHDDFFELGGHSLMATRLVSRLRDRFGVEVPIDVFFEAPTVAGLARRIAAAAGGAAAMPIRPAPRDGDLPLSFAQQRLWFLTQLEPASPWYNMPLAVRFQGPLDPALLERAAAEVLRRHESLRTTFAQPGAEPVQVVSPPAPFNLPVVALDGISLEGTTGPHEEVRRLVAAEARRPFDLLRGPLWRLRALRLAAEDHVVMLTMHHIVSDGWSVGLFLHELTAFYGAFARGEELPLPPLPLQYADFAAWQRAWLTGDVLAAQTGYWRERLGGALPVLELPLDRPRPPLQTFRGARLAMGLPAELAERLRALARGRGATLFMVLLAAFKTLLRRYTGQEDLLVGVPIAGRNRSEIEGLIGFFVNTLVLRTDLAGDPTFEELLDRVRETTVGAYAHQDLPFEKLVEEVRPRRDLARSPLFQVMLGLENNPTAMAAPALPGGLAVTRLEADSGASRFEWTLFLSELGDGGSGGIVGSLEYNTDLFDEATVRRMLGHFASLLEAVAGDPSERISRLRLLSREEEEQLVVEWNATARDFALDRPVHVLIAEQAARTPGAPAVACEGEALSYGELDARANRLARRLRALGVGPEVPVGLYLERSLDLPVALLAVWKAGGAYVPLDPAYPRERLAWMLEDSGAPVVLTHGSLLSTVPPSAARAVCLDREDVAGESATSPDVPTGPESLAYILYTSGSTGWPKGVQIPHGALVNFLESMRERPGLAASDRLLAVTSLSFDIAGLELYLPLLAGAEVEIASRALAADGPRLLSRLEAATVLQATPSTWRLLLDAGWEGSGGLKALCGGEALPPKLAGEIAVRAGSLWNLYGPTETTIWSATRLVGAEAGEGAAPVSIGRPIANTAIYVVDANLRPAPVGVPGELLIGGAGLARGYRRRPDLTAERFIPDPFATDPGSRLYRTGDLARWREDREGGQLEFLGRIDHQVKVRGYRIELGEIEAALEQHPGVRAAVVVVREDAAGDQRLIAYVVATDGTAEAGGGLRRHLRSKLPEYMVPAAFVTLPELPLLPNGKVDRKALPAPTLEGRERPEAAPPFAAPASRLEGVIAEAWRGALKLGKVGVHDNFFDLGGHSLLMAQVHHNLVEALPDGLGARLTMVELFQYPTVAALARHLRPETAGAVTEPGRLRAEVRLGSLAGSHAGREIAIVGMSGRFPGAADIEGFWRNLRDGIESISRFSEEELAASGVEPEVFRSSGYINAKGLPDGIGWFDAGFFGYTPREAEIIDPQQRMFLEVAWEALENAGCDPERYPGSIGVFAGSGLNTYLVNLYSNPELMAAVGGFQAMIGNDKDFLPTRVSYKLNLKGPSLNVQTACSTSLVAVHLACQHLLHGECDMALAGGVTLYSPVKAGTMYQEGGILALDGHCRAFDERSQGTVVGNGAAVVVLKRVEDALADGDSIHAVIKGSAINNDGSGKVGYTAPSVEGQAAVISQALAVAGVEPGTVRYVETHGTGTALGDPIEIAALTRAFRAGTDGTGGRGFCGIGSVKSNVGHLDTAAGAAGLIKAVLTVERGELPPSLHFERPNPALGLPETPFYVVDRLTPWPDGGGPRRAGVSAFGIGGTNAHVVLEQAPPAEPSSPSRAAQLLVLSARTEAALETATDNLARHLREHPDQPLADAAFTLQTGRKVFRHRRTIIASSVEEAAALLAARDPKRVLSRLEEATDRPVVFMFAGAGAQYPDMGLDLYREEPVFREQVDLCLELLEPHVDAGVDLRRYLFPEPESAGEAARLLERTAIALPVLFAVEYAQAKLWMSWGVQPRAMIGHSLGEYAAACLAGVMSLEDALATVALRGRLFETLREGGMLAVPLPEGEVLELLAEAGMELSIAAVNSPSFCVVSGPTEAIARAREAFAGRGIDARRLHIDVAAHSTVVEPILREFGDFVATLALSPPRIPYISNVTGTWMTAADAADPGYWVRHLRQTVRFGDGISELLAEEERIFLEVGPGQTLSTLVMQHPARPAGPTVLSSLRHPHDQQSDTGFLLQALCKLWLAGAAVDWAGFYSGERRRRLRLPTYPFERQRYWVEPRRFEDVKRRSTAGKQPDVADWFWVPSWRQASAPSLPASPAVASWLLFLDRHGIGDLLAGRLREMGQRVATVTVGEAFARLGEAAWTVRPRERSDYAALLRDLGETPDGIAHLWCVGEGPAGLPPEDLGFYSLLALAQALSERAIPKPVRIEVVSTGVQPVTGEERIEPEKALILGLVKVVPQEMPGLGCRSIDVDLPERGSRRERIRTGQLAADLVAALADPPPPSDFAVAWRGAHRWVQGFEAVRLPDGGVPCLLRPGGVYLITGGLGGVGLALAEHLARTVQAKLVLIGRSGLSDRKLRRLEGIEELGSEVLVASADVTDAGALRAVLAESRRRFGQGLSGAIHAAGIASGGMVQLKTPESAAAVLAPKVMGTRALAAALADEPLDFFVLCSAVNSVLGGFGRVDFCAASAFLDAFAHQRSAEGEGSVAIAIGWDTWAEVGVVAEAELPPDLEEVRRESLVHGMTTLEGMAAFDRILGSGLPRVVVSTRWLPDLIERDASAGGAAAGETAAAPRLTASHGRPALSTAYVAPASETEHAVAAIWEEFLGIQGLGVHDNFFELGGHSLMATQITSRFRNTFQAELSIACFFEEPTIAGLAATLSRQAEEASGTEAERVSLLLDEVEGLSDEELDALLAAEENLMKSEELNG